VVVIVFEFCFLNFVFHFFSNYLFKLTSIVSALLFATMIDDSVQAENAVDFGMSEHDIRPNYESDNENRDDENRDDEKRDDEKRDDDTCVKCEKTFNRISGGTYDGLLFIILQ